MTSRELLLKKNIPETAIETIGLPFAARIHRVQKMKKRYEKNLRSMKANPVILIMMGGAGGSKSYHYAKKIGQMDLSAHLIVVMGKQCEDEKRTRKNSASSFEFNDASGVY